jgi:antitoxin component HigA of HigAB toxin-antitoxin module
MEANNLQPVDLIGVFGSSNLVSEIIGGKKSIDKNHAQKLSDSPKERLCQRFNLPIILFLK